jgi:hypothetical protein
MGFLVEVIKMFYNLKYLYNCECTKNHWVLHFKRVNLIIYEIKSLKIMKPLWKSLPVSYKTKYLVTR